MEILFASGNQHKKSEMLALFAPHTVSIPQDKGFDFNPVESGTSFCENSLIKARSLWDMTKCPVLADDSGLCIDALNGKPGIFSARYAGKDFPAGMPNNKTILQEEKNRLIIEELNTALQSKDLSVYAEENRTCRFVCAMTLYLDNERFVCVQETCEGIIVPSIKEGRGKDGFGYDPIVYIPDVKRTIAELSPEEKNTISHRAKASKKIRLFLQNRNM